MRAYVDVFSDLEGVFPDEGGTGGARVGRKIYATHMSIGTKTILIILLQIVCVFGF